MMLMGKQLAIRRRQLLNVHLIKRPQRRQRRIKQSGESRQIGFSSAGRHGQAKVGRQAEGRAGDSVASQLNLAALKHQINQVIEQLTQWGRLDRLGNRLGTALMLIHKHAGLDKNASLFVQTANFMNCFL